MDCCVCDVMAIFSHRNIRINDVNLNDLGNAPVCTQITEPAIAAAAADEDNNAYATRGEGVTMGGGAVVAAMAADGASVPAGDARAVLTHTVSESAAFETTSTVSAQQQTALLRARVERLATGANETAPHFVSRTGALFKQSHWRPLAFPWHFPYGVGDSVCSTRRVAISETEADRSLLLTRCDVACATCDARTHSHARS